ncbi:phasin family protein [Citromicrobium sp. JLT1363]|uniref:phasin family protein n=1 Tax=Citromicrobium sp. JLT1363 TaxID=517722 RepID=UPI000225E05C|nr:phasin family protein [Citromicrobium sp. JLT1363]
MADETDTKGDAAAQKAYESAVEAKSGSKPAEEAPAAPAETPAPAAAKAEAKPAAKAAAPAKAEPVKAEAAPKPKKAAPRKKAAVAKAAKAPAKKAPAKTSAAKTTAQKKTTTKSGAKRTAKTSRPKDTTMATKTQTKTADMASNMANEMQTRLAGMYEKGTEMTGEMVTFQRANAEAMAEAGKILFTGMQDMTREAVEESRKAADQISEDARLMAAAKSPTELVKLQGDIMRRSFDNAVAAGSKNTEAWIKLTNDAMAPLTSRVSEAVEKMNKVAA